MMKSNVLASVAALASVFILAACGGGGGGGGSPTTETQQPQNRVITCENCQPAQLQAFGSAAAGAQAGDNVVLTLSLTDAQHAEVLAWLNGGENLPPPSAICTEGIYETHADDHRDLTHAQRWAIVRNGITLEVDGRKEHGRHLIVDFPAEYVAAAATAAAKYDAAAAAADQMWPECLAEIISGNDCAEYFAANNAAVVEYNATIAAANNAFKNAVQEHRASRNKHGDRHDALENSYRPGDIVRVLEGVLESDENDNTPFPLPLYCPLRGPCGIQAQTTNSDNNNLPAGDYRVIREIKTLRKCHRTVFIPGTVGGERACVPSGGFYTITVTNTFFAMPLTLSTGERANNCNAAPTTNQYYVLESGDNAWRTTGGFAFNMRGILTAGAIQTDNFLFAHANNLRDLHVELRTAPLTLAGIGIYADTGYKSENEGETQAHYGKLMGVMPLLENHSRFLPALDLYAAASAGKVESDYYENSRLRGFAAGIFARRFLRHNDEWHIRIRQPLAAAEIAEWQFAADARIGESGNMLTLGYFRKLHGKSGATILWRRKF